MFERNEMPIETLLTLKSEHAISDEEIHELWFDWFCSSNALIRKGKTLLTKLNAVTKNTKRFDPKKTYVCFKNNWPQYGDERLYDDFRICDMDNGSVIYCVTPRNPYGDADVWGQENHFEEPLVKGTWNDVKNFFKGE